MSIRDSYNAWAEQYDTNVNRTRDLEHVAVREMLANVHFDNCLEIGCGTGKNTLWLASKAKSVMAVDFSEEMLKKASQKISSPHVRFVQADIKKDWSFADQKFDLIVFSLVLEHIKDLDHIFRQTSLIASPGAHVYIGELHPFKQYTGSKARFETSSGSHVLECETHHISDFLDAGARNGFDLVKLNEYFDEDGRSLPPRILALMLKQCRIPF